MTRTRETAGIAEDQIASALDLLADLGAGLAAGVDLERTLHDSVRRITDYLDADGGALFLLEDEGKTLRCHASVGSTDIAGVTLPSDRGIVGRSVQANQGEIVRDVSSDPGFYSSVDEQTGYTTRSILCAPLSVREERLGAIELVNKRSQDGLFDTADLRMLETLAASAALAILNARMAVRLVDQERLQRELELAAEIQRSLLPAAPDASFPIHGINVPARTVSGDFYDFFTKSDGSIAFCIGDVSGKGMNAALLMAKTVSLFRCLGKDDPQPGRLLGRINQEIHETSTRGMFVTMICGIYNPGTRSIRFANAGHEPPMFHRGGKTFDTFTAAAPPLGITAAASKDNPYPEVHLALAGGAFYAFTDGLTEGHPPDAADKKAAFGAGGVRRILQTTAAEPVPARLEALVSAVTPREGDLRDDITILALDAGS